jgi:hypothetical protein
MYDRHRPRRVIFKRRLPYLIGSWQLCLLKGILQRGFPYYTAFITMSAVNNDNVLGIMGRRRRPPLHSPGTTNFLFFNTKG